MLARLGRCERFTATRMGFTAYDSRSSRDCFLALSVWRRYSGEGGMDPRLKTTARAFDFSHTLKSCVDHTQHGSKTSDSQDSSVGVPPQ